MAYTLDPLQKRGCDRDGTSEKRSCRHSTANLNRPAANMMEGHVKCKQPCICGVFSHVLQGLGDDRFPNSKLWG